ncbi:MAG: capsular biosynthesis protein, partial [Acidobacteria bacterium]|nr:capsular biosynthesis protein [Acidobacteriota bacterium]
MTRLFAALLLCALPAAAAERFYQFSIDQDRLAGAPDFSRLNRALTPADRVFVRGGHFFRLGKDLKPNTADDQAVRFFGTNLCFGANFPDPADAGRIAKRHRRLGVNLVRLHHTDTNPDPEESRANSFLTQGPYPSLNPVSIARLRTLLDAFKAEGIYINLNLHIGYEFRPAIDRVPPIPGADRLPTQSKP